MRNLFDSSPPLKFRLYDLYSAKQIHQSEHSFFSSLINSIGITDNSSASLYFYPYNMAISVTYFFLVRIVLHVVGCIIRMSHGKRTVYWPNARIRFHFIGILIRTSPVKRAIYRTIIRIRRHFIDIPIRTPHGKRAIFRAIVRIKLTFFPPAFLRPLLAQTFLRNLNKTPHIYSYGGNLPLHQEVPV